MEKYDLLVIGAGAGLLVIEAALGQGLKCALVEKAKIGGTCLTKGCIPSKMLVYPADMIRVAGSSESWPGLSAAPRRLGKNFAARLARDQSESKN